MYNLYETRGYKGNVVVDMRKEIGCSKQLLCETIVRFDFPKKMKAIYHRYHDKEQYKNDWVASQQKMLRDIFTSAREKISDDHHIKTSFVSGGISRNPAFREFEDWKCTLTLLQEMMVVVALWHILVIVSMKKD